MSQHINPPAKSAAHQSARSTLKINKVALNLRQLPVTVDDLALMLEIDLAFGRRDDYRYRLQRALEDAYRQGRESAPPQ